jgi:RNA polymerase sigma factor (sigma-70 family)
MEGSMSSLPAHTLDGLLTRLRNGDRDVQLERRLNEAFGKYHGRLHAYCARQLQALSGGQVQEVVQDVLLEAWIKLPTYRREGRFLSFLLGIAFKKCAGARRRIRDAFLEDEVVDTARSVLAELSDAERDGLVRDAAERVLTPEERAVVELRWVLDYSRPEVAERAGITVDEVRVVLQRCKRRLEPVLRELLTGPAHPPGAGE